MHHHEWCDLGDGKEICAKCGELHEPISFSLDEPFEPYDSTDLMFPTVKNKVEKKIKRGRGF